MSLPSNILVPLRGTGMLTLNRVKGSCMVKSGFTHYSVGAKNNYEKETATKSQPSGRRNFTAAS